MQRICITALSLLLIGSFTIAAAQTTPASAAGETPMAQVNKLTQEWNQKQQDFFKRYQQAKTDQERQNLAQSYPDPRPYARKLLEIAKANPHTAAARDALIFIVQNVSESLKGNDIRTEAFDQLATQFANDSQISQIIPSLEWAPSAEPLLRAIAQKNGDHRTQGLALFTLAQNLKSRAEAVASMEAGKAPQAQIAEVAGKSADGKIRTSDEMNQDAERLFNEVISRYGDVGGYRGSLADASRSELFELHNLRVGKPAPEITGTTVDGKTMTLSSYRGKVVVLDFWGDW